MKRTILVILAILFLLSLLLAFYAFNVIKSPNVKSCTGDISLTIPKGSDYEDLLALLEGDTIIKNMSSFNMLANYMNLPNHVYSGKYLIPCGISNQNIIRRLRGRQQIPINVTFNNIRTLEELSSKVSTYLEFDSTELITLLRDSTYLASKKFTAENINTVFLPNTYQMYWSTSPKQFVDRMLKEYNSFWTDERLGLADSLGLSSHEVITLASIVEEETSKEDEKDEIARVYLNRLEQGWKLQADPTVKMAIGDFTIRRVLNRHLKTDSPYNTYMYKGLPPGPIRMPSTKSINAVLNPAEHDYMYFCAKADFSGYHAFAKTNKEHMRNARNFQKAMNKRKIFR